MKMMLKKEKVKKVNFNILEIDEDEIKIMKTG
jgi:hypothetical protein